MCTKCQGDGVANKLALTPPAFSRVFTAASTSSSCSEDNPLFPRPYCAIAMVYGSLMVAQYEGPVRLRDTVRQTNEAHLDAHNGLEECVLSLFRGCSLHMRRTLRHSTHKTTAAEPDRYRGLCLQRAATDGISAISFAATVP